MEIGKDNKEFRAGAFFGLVAGILILALTTMAFLALDPGPSAHVIDWDVSVPESQTIVLPNFESPLSPNPP